MPIIASSSNSEGGLGQALVGEKVTINATTTVLVKELLGEGTLLSSLILNLALSQSLKDVSTHRLPPLTLLLYAKVVLHMFI
jgi:hypothetical protein